jgi:hypothetical protein
VLDGVATVTVEFILEKDLSEAVNDVRDAVSRVRADLPAEMRDPSVTKASTAGRVVLTFTARRAGRQAALDMQDLSWFVDNTVAKRLLSVPGVGAVKRVGGVTAKCASNSTPPHGGAARVGAGRLAPAAQRAARSAGRTRRRQRRRAVGAHPRHRADGAGAGAMDIPLPDGRHVRLDQVATVTDTVAEPRAWPSRTAARWSASKSSAPAARANWTWPTARAPPSPSCRRKHPNVVLREVIDNAAPVRGKLRRLDGDAVRRRDPGGAGGVVVPARLARHLVAAAALPLSVIPPSSASTCSATR